MAAKAGKGGGSKPDIASILGLLVALGGIVGGLILEGGKLSDISQFTAAMIVCGGTLGAVMVTTPLSVLIGGIKQLTGVFLEKSHNPTHIIEEIIGYATRARKNGIVSLESELEKIHDPFLKKALSLAVDGTDLQELRKIMELEITAEEERAEAEAKVYEAAGGYAPTVGIIGAVMGLIQVMKDLADIEKVGHGIATAFVATVYGVALSNLFCLPAATKLKTRAHHAMKTKELMLEGIVSIVEGMNPKLIRMKLAAYEEQGASKKAAKAAAARRPASLLPPKVSRIMARPKKHPAHENHERWLVSYADFITLLFAFFVVMFASSQADKGKAKQVSDSVREALENGGVSGTVAAVAKVLGGTVDDTGQGNAQMKGPGGAKKAAKEAPPEQTVELLPSMKALTSDLESEIKAGKLEINLQARGLVVSLREAAFFPSGADLVDPKSSSTLEKVAKALNNVPNGIRLEGHTDSVPIHTAQFKSNWELSAARGIAMLNIFADRFAVERSRMAIVGYADTNPVASNDTVEGRARNRRVDVVILSELGLKATGKSSEQEAPAAEKEKTKEHAQPKH